jgi:hypothetical protein
VLGQLGRGVTVLKGQGGTAGAGHGRSEPLPSVAASMPAATSGMIPRSR